MSAVTMVMYHYVRPLNRTRYPDIKGRDVDDFVRQVARLMRRHTIVGFDEVISASSGGPPLPERAAVLTFDDGMIDHFTYVTPILADLGVSGAFFAPSASIEDRRLLDVHRVHHVLASGASVEELRSQIDGFVVDHADLCVQPAEYWNRYATPSRFDPPDVVYVKRMLQTALPYELRTDLAERLFARYVTTNEEAFVEEFYVNVPQLRLMREIGMHIGSHGHEHFWLSHQPPDVQTRDLARSVEMLRNVGVDVERGWTLCYPYGDHDHSTVRIARELGCVAAVTTESRVADIPGDDLLRLPRLDTNEVPIGS